MKITLIRKLVAVALIALFSQFSLAQDAGGAIKQIADIVVSINHFPSDADKAALADIAGNDALPENLRNMATAVSNISHAASAEGKAMMASIQANGEAPDRAKSLAGIIASLNHMPSDEAKATLAELFP
ncbi:MAG TPA: hypothetical protein EYG31_05700 [Porticoccaceae bacterium]|nr:hypothetical protein [Gammaproteobacteria bacterium]HIL60111.1 hypothetical protein [Porticoccaceae bacterium]